MTPRDAPSLLSKRVLVELSHAIERFALAAEPDAPLLVIAMFQKLSYFSREADVYGEIAGTGAVTLVGLVEDFPPALPNGVRHVLLGRGDLLAREWSVTVLGPAGGAVLVAIDQETVEDDAPTLEQGRLFRGWWSFRRDDAYQEVLRLRSLLRLPPATVAEIDEVLEAVIGTPERTQNYWYDVPLHFLADRMDSALQGWSRARLELENARHGGDRDPRTGLFTTEYLERWTAGLGEGTLPIGLVVLRLLDVDLVRQQYGMRIEITALQTVARTIQELTPGSGRVVQVDRGEFLVILPGAGPDAVLEIGRGACARVAQMDQWYPFVTLHTAVAATVTRDRPLPVASLLDEVARTAADGDVRLLTV